MLPKNNNRKNEIILTIREKKETNDDVCVLAGGEQLVPPDAESVLLHSAVCEQEAGQFRGEGKAILRHVEERAEDPCGLPANGRAVP